MFCVQIAEVLVAIENRYAFTERLCADYIVDALPDECTFSVSATPEEIAAENSDDGTFSPAYCESLALYRKICTRMLDYDAFLLHAAIVSYAGCGFAFRREKRHGKSTPRRAVDVRAGRRRDGGERRQTHPALAKWGSRRGERRWGAE